jgi:hypothetical protein
MRILLIISCMLLLTACDERKTAAERTQEIETFADPKIQSYKKAQQVQGVVDMQAAEQQEELRNSDVE